MYGCLLINVLIFKNEIFSRLPYTLWMYQMKYNVILAHNFINKNILLWGWNKMTSSIWHLYIKRVMKRLMVVGSSSNFFDVHYFFFPLEFCICHSLNELPTHLCTQIMVPLLHHFQPIWIKAWWDFFPRVQFPFWWHFCFLINSRQSKYPSLFF